MNSQIKIYSILLLPVLLTACNTLTVSNDGKQGAQSEVSAGEPITSISDNNVSQQTVSEASASVKEQPELDGDSLFNLLAAEFAGNSGDVESALKYYNQAAKTIDDSRIAARRAYIALYGENYDEALVALKRWHELDPDSKDLSRMYAITYLRLEQSEKAVPYIAVLLDELDESSINEAMAVKQLLAKNASTEDAYFVLQQLNEKEKNNQHLLVLQSRYAAQLKKYDESLATLDKVLEIDPSLHEVLIIKARILSAQGKNVEAAKIIKQVLDELPANNALRLQYARMLVEQRKLSEAIEQYSILNKKLPDDAEVTLSLALLNIETNNLDEAIDALEHLIDIDKRVSIANYYLGRISQNQGEEKQAIAYYLRVRTDDYSFDAQLRVGILLARLGKTDEALAKLDALADAPGNWTLRVQSYLAQGEILRDQKRYKEGVEMYSRALQQNSDDTSLLYARGLMAEKVDRLDMVEADLLKVISKEPDNANALNALGYTLADRTERYKEALKYIKRAAELVPDDPAILDSLGWVSYRLGEMDNALKWLSQAFEKLVDAEIAAHYGEVLWHSEQKDKARVVWNQGKEQNPSNSVLLETLNRLKP
ncbi:MAG: tetratricopeptide repeat protein [Gammaproteobacteria bacterium]|nr:tetratricopeptide repeat protein [Gammaproteobacteria bacterium]